ncbi:DUF6702 family protein [Chitinophaga alhagiae]|uniref:DUF6702 family protein n=1 Tax=Chitinophaga alhagiae TaxID=2203219 RepID=UPI000E5A3EE5|nr:DUF6702 family protein [Chitinophaga alhagiae]
MGLLLCKWFLPLWISAVHPFYLSVTEIRHNAPRKTLEISCRIFSDDLENALKKHYSTSFDIVRPQNRPAVDTMIAQYIGRHLQIKADGKPLSLRYLGYRIEEDATWCFLEIAGVPDVKKLDLRNDMLYKEHATQSHMIHAIVNNKRQSTKIDNPNATAGFSF